MPADLGSLTEARSPSPSRAPSNRGSGSGSGSGKLITSSADVVYLAEELFLRLFILALVFVLVGAGLSIWSDFGDRDTPDLVTISFAMLGATFAVAGLTWPRRLYGWLRYTPRRQVTPALAGAAALVVTGPESPTWWLALALLLLCTTLSSIRLSLAAATVAGGAYLAGTAVRGAPIIAVSDGGALASTVGLIAYTIVGAFVADGFGRFVLEFHRLESEATAPPPRRVANLATPAQAAAGGAHPPAVRPGRGNAVAPSRLTPRQLEAALLACDGLRQAEIAVLLGISPRQVERLLGEARERANAATTGQLVALLVTGGLARPTPPTPALTTSDTTLPAQPDIDEVGSVPGASQEPQGRGHH